MKKVSNCSIATGISFSNELACLIQQKADAMGVSFPWLVRQACITYLALNGYDVSGVSNPVGRGVRTDLKKPTRAETEAIIAHLKKTRKLKL